MIRLFALIILSAWITLPTWGQVLNIEKTRAGDDSTKKWKGNAEFSFNFRQQQVRSSVLGLKTNLTRLTKKHNYSFITDLNALQAEGEDVVSNGFAHLRGHFNKTDKISEEVFGQYQYDDIRGLKERALLGAGLRMSIPLGGEEKSSLTFGPGVMYEHEKWSFSEVDSTTKFWKSTNYISFNWQMSKTAEFTLTGYYQSRWGYFFDRPRLNADASLSFKINKHLTFVSAFDIMYDARPVVAIDKTIYGIENAIRLNF